MRQLKLLNISGQMSERQAAISIIEVMVSAALIGTVLTALAINLVYTQRTLENTLLRAKATDQAQSCLDRFRALRDANEWPIFCTRLKSLSGRINYPSISYSGVSVCDDIGESRYYVLYHANFDDARDDSGSESIDSLCPGDRSKKFTVFVTVKYYDANHKQQKVTVKEQFARGALDAEYRTP